MTNASEQRQSPTPEGRRSAEPESGSFLKNWSVWIGVAAVGLAAFLLYRTLSNYSLDELVSSVSDIPAGHLAAAAGFAALSYLCLTGFDYLALIYAGNRLSYRKAALTSFTSLSLGHNIGFAALSSGAIRYRFYSRWGVDAEKMAKIVLFSGSTVGLGMLALAGVALLLQGDVAMQLTGLGRAPILGLGALCLLLVAGYLALAAFARQELKVWKWSFRMPGLKLALAQIAVGALNFAFVAACLHQTVAAVAEVSYFSAASAYVIANATALVSHVPGGLGVIEAVVTHLLSERGMIGAVLAFRFVYYLAPLGLGAVTFAVSEMLLKGTGAPSASPSAA